MIKWKNIPLIFPIILNSLIFIITSAEAQSQSQTQSEDIEQTEEVRNEFGNWLQVCKKETEKCVALQFALNIQGEKAARFVLERLIQSAENPANSIVTFFIPFESSIPLLHSGLSFRVDANEPFFEQFLFCDQLGCTSQFGITDKGIDLLKQGANLTIQINDIRDSKSSYIMDLDLDQFIKIYDKLAVKN